MTDQFSFPRLLEDIATIAGGIPGTVLRYAASLVRHLERHNAKVAERIDRERRTMQAAGIEALRASRIAGHESKGSGAR